MSDTTLSTLYQRALFQATQRYVEEVPINAWIMLVMGNAHGWHHAKDYTAYVQGSLELNRVIFAAISCHPDNAGALPLHHVVHPITIPIPTEDGICATDIHFDMVVQWFEDTGLQRRLAMDLADAILADRSAARDFFNSVEDPIHPVVKCGKDIR